MNSLYSIFPISQQRQKQINRLLNKMTLAQKIGQMIYPGYTGIYQSADSSAYKKIKNLIKHHGIGGIVLFRGDLYAYYELIENLQAESEIPLLFSADFERGLAMRISNTLSFPLNMALARTGETGLAERMGKSIASECKALGVSMNFAPVVDLVGEKKNPVINTRSFGSRKEVVAEFANAFIKGATSQKILSSLKHFPGHGFTTMDSHRELPLINKSKKKMMTEDIYPFRKCIEAGVQSVMMAHLEVPAFEKEKGLPATLSHAIITGLLRESLAFDGLIVTDAMNMNGVTSYFSAREAAVLAIKAGNDMLLLPPDEEIAINALIEAVTDGIINQDQINKSVERILYAKMWTGLFDKKKTDYHKLKNVVSNKQSEELAREIADKSVYFSKEAKKHLPAKLKKPVFCVTVTDNNPTEKETYFSGVLRTILPGTQNIFVTPFITKTVLDRITASLNKQHQVIVPIYYRARSYQGRLELPEHLLNFFSTLDKKFPDTLYIFFGNPFLSEQLGKGKNIVFGYGDVPVTQSAVLSFLTGIKIF